ncbi:hypothetical protein EIN_359740 [Entamoeba invadens IP1]|uniref:Uncharacterized protein n=1 Tax=Entamoeba invadens IP1 TaxID=370355 RepID=A0A0A1UB99_ENTIV|nr:hypothetical protein EIN_359740 [Entamoeba invadens IP1]ELP90881.1 hypothetical protein EIN_359740 [Entamoeba invadens IP1]|eukprot:XP_004257652.1 hypothetical protein EIN_359740 [Entamoeba invadens IP1]
MSVPRKRGLTVSRKIKVVSPLKNNPIIVDSDYTQEMPNIPMRIHQASDRSISTNPQCDLTNFFVQNYKTESTTPPPPTSPVSKIITPKFSLVDSLIQNYDSESISVIQQLSILQKKQFTFMERPLKDLIQSLNTDNTSLL